MPGPIVGYAADAGFQGNWRAAGIDPAHGRWIHSLGFSWVCAIHVVRHYAAVGQQRPRFIHAAVAKQLGRTTGPRIRRRIVKICLRTGVRAD